MSDDIPAIIRASAASPSLNNTRSPGEIVFFFFCCRCCCLFFCLRFAPNLVPCYDRVSQPGRSILGAAAHFNSGWFHHPPPPLVHTYSARWCVTSFQLDFFSFSAIIISHFSALINLLAAESFELKKKKKTLWKTWFLETFFFDRRGHELSRTRVHVRVRFDKFFIGKLWLFFRVVLL